ncbi:MAG: SAM-dependent methyltransferase [Pseudomonadota bacterium]
MNEPAPSAGVTQDAFLDGAVTIIQPTEGYRAGMDAVLLAASLEAAPGARLLEAGTGAGAALLCAAYRLPEARFVGLERDARMAELARRSAKYSKLEGRAEIWSGDIGHRSAELENVFDQSFANPPYFDREAVKPPSPGREDAYLADAPLDAWIKFLLHTTKPKGRITLIHRAHALADILAFLHTRAGEIEVLPIFTSPGKAAKRVLIRARKGLRKGDVVLYQGVNLYQAPGGMVSERTEAVLRGGPLDWR